MYYFVILVDFCETLKAYALKTAQNVCYSVFCLQFLFIEFLNYISQHCFICRPSDFAVSEDAAHPA